MRKMLVLMALLFLAGYSYADHNYENNGSFGAGYQEGYEHGRADGRARAGFEFRHDEEYQRGDCEFRLGYVEGYSDGFFNKPPITHGGGYGDNYGGGYPGGYPGGDYGNGRGGVIVYTERDFRGSTQGFGPGQYPYLSGRFNDSIESIRLEGGFRVILFDKSDFRGERTVVERSSYDLGYFRNRAASMIIEPIGYR